MEKKIAVPVDNLGKLDAHFGHCKLFEVLTVQDNKIESKDRLVPPPHEPGLFPKWLAEKGVTDIIAGGMGQRAIQLFNQQGVNAYVGAPQLSADEIVAGFVEGKLEFTANYGDH